MRGLCRAQVQKGILGAAVVQRAAQLMRQHMTLARVSHLYRTNAADFGQIDQSLENSNSTLVWYMLQYNYRIYKIKLPSDS